MKNELHKNSLLKDTLKLAIPVALQQLLTASLHLVDTTMVVTLGDISTAAIGAAGRWFFLMHLFLFGFGSGMSVLISQFWGIRDKKTIHKTFGLGIINMLVVSILFCSAAVMFPKALISVFSNEAAVIAEGARYLQVAALSFIPLAVSMAYGYLMRSTENVVTPLIISFITVGTNTLLNYILIFGKLGIEPMGIRGAAIATATSSTLQCVLYIVVSNIRQNIAAAKLRSMIPRDKAFVKKYYITAMPVLINEVMWALGVNVYNFVLGRQGSSNYAAYTLFSSIEQTTFTFFIGLCSACAVIIGKMVGQSDAEQAYQSGKKYLRAVVIMGFIVGGLLFGMSGPVVNWLPVEKVETAQMAIRLLRIYACYMPMFMLPYIAIVGIFRAGGDTKTGMMIDVVNVWLIGVPITLLAGFYFKLDFEYIFALMYTEHIFKVVMCLKHFKSKKWLRQLT